MKRLSFFFLLITLLSVRVTVAQPPGTFRLTPFTGIDYVRLVVDASYRASAANTFKAVIRSAKDNSILWQGAVNPEAVKMVEKDYLQFTVKSLKPILWEPVNPYLYEVTLQQYRGGKLLNELKQRLGFRSFASRNGNLFLNGKPIFLRGIAINPPGRGIPDSVETSRSFAEDYVRFMKSIHVNIIRIPDDETWFNVCDELGMMVFGGNYGSKVAAGEKVGKFEQVGDETDGGFPKDYDRGVSWYENIKLGAIAHHPSLMVYAMTNETPFKGSRAVQWEKFLDYAYHKLKQWDETRVYIANAGYGYGKTGDICDLHRYWGWYYSSPFTFLHIRNNADIIPFPKKVGQPITFTECVGNYTGPDGRYNLTPAHKNPSSQLTWTGHAAQNLQAQLADEHQSFTMKQVTETFRQLRVVNNELSGVFPFTILFYNWNTVQKFMDMNPKPVTDQVKISYQPVLLSWECWTPNAFAGAEIHPVAHIINDSDDFKDLKNVTLSYQLKDKAGMVFLSDSIKLGDIRYYGTVQKELSVKLPENLVTGNYWLAGKVKTANRIVSENTYKLFIGDKLFTRPVMPLQASVALYDNNGKTKAAFGNLKIDVKQLNNPGDIAKGSFLVIGENAADETFVKAARKIKDFVAKGGRVIVLRQDSLHLPNVNAILNYKLQNSTVDIDDPVYPVSSTAPRNGYYVNPERPEHPVFYGITRENLKVWSDYSNWNESKPGMPQIYPVTDGFMFENRDAVGDIAILGNYASGLQSVALAEQFDGAGSVLLCGMDLANRAGADPVASRLLTNMLEYSSKPDGHERYQLVTSPIIWGEYETEKGIVTDYYSGFLVNSTPRIPAYNDLPKQEIVVTKEGYQFAGGRRSGFNTRPGIQYVANGRRPWGPYAQTFGGQPKLIDSSTTGTAKFWCRIPQGFNTMSSVVWNPAKEPLSIHIKVNDLPEKVQVINAGGRISVDCPVNATNVNVTYAGDRRLVVLETAFK
ncbi:glycosyl hydrolase family 2 [Pedobacter sp. BS3]|uniref:glycoside hydrolase family 2 TIM barrel-domain containing protein n=1 Tax=Pedobacter sp. BS3 TaxID=2567937 RepID=UPI0011ECF7E2|nr:glycoside hydrolase family 2 TIM barrel-domain containing protein [Pedobacter sp. BS3]TZF81006.1 glycosyl hydrolase family 2 [Pedobacter sp. BS3]